MPHRVAVFPARRPERRKMPFTDTCHPRFQKVWRIPMLTAVVVAPVGTANDVGANTARFVWNAPWLCATPTCEYTMVLFDRA